MNDRQLDKKIRKDTTKVKQDLSTLLEDSANRMSRLESKASQATGQAKEKVTTWVEDGISHLSKRFEKMAGDVRQTGLGAAATLKKDVGHGLKQYNARVQEAAYQVPNGFGKQAARYPWVAITITIVLAVSFLLGILLQPSPRTVAQV